MSLIGKISLIKQLFRSIVNKVRLGDYWRSIWKKHGYGSRKLSEEKVVWVVKARESGLAARDIASTQNITVRRVEQLYAQYRESGEIPSLKKAGRKRIEIPIEERNAIIEASRKFGVGACYLVSILKRDYGIDETNHMRVYSVLKEEGLLYNTARTRFKRKWIRYEREHSNSLWHVDWHEMKSSVYRGKWLVIYEDDASRYILGYGVFDSPSSENAVSVLKEAIREHGRPASILSDRGTSFYAVEAETKTKGLTEFELLSDEESHQTYSFKSETSPNQWKIGEALLIRLKEDSRRDSLRLRSAYAGTTASSPTEPLIWKS